MMAIGFKGGVSLYTSLLGSTGLTSVGIVLLISVIVPIYVVFIMSRFENDDDAVALSGVFNSTLT
ncbi:MAG: hypothetical protein ACJA0M_000569 [Chitinophagales bacterium]|jgi:hypothetical protein